MIWKNVKQVAQPYTLIIKLSALALLAGVLFVGGCSYGKSSQAATVVTLQRDLGDALAANQKYEALNAERNRLAKLAAKVSAEQEAAALKAGQRAGKVQKEQSTVEEKNEEARGRAMRDPKCAELMEMQVCSIVPLP